MKRPTRGETRAAGFDARQQMGDEALADALVLIGGVDHDVFEIEEGDAIAEDHAGGDDLFLIAARGGDEAGGGERDPGGRGRDRYKVWPSRRR